MPILKTEAIVLRSHKWSESSNIVTLCTRDFGKLKVIAKGARRPDSRFGNSLSPITQSQILFYSRNSGGLHTLKEAFCINYFPNLKRELETLTYASALCELTEYLTPEAQPSRPAYHILRETLDRMEACPLEEFEKLFWHFELRIFAVAGYFPRLSDCVSCKASVEDSAVSFSFAWGGVLCEKCSSKDAGAKQVLPGTIKLLRMLQKVEMEKVGNIEINPLLKEQIGVLLDSYWRYHTQEYRKLKSLQVLRQIRQ